MSGLDRTLLRATKIDSPAKGLQTGNKSSSNRTFRIGIVGIGAIGIVHAGILNTIPGCKVAAICDSNPMLTRFGGKLLSGVKFHDSYLEMIDEDGLDAIYVTTPGHTHKRIVTEAIRASSSLSVFTEKPLAANLEDANSMAAEARAGNGTYSVGFQKRHLGSFRKAHGLIQARAIGEPQFFNALNHTADVFAAHKGWRFQPETGGVALDFSPHLIDLLLWYFGQPKEITSMRRSVYSTEVEDYFHSMFTYESGLLGNLDVSWSSRNYKPNEMQIEVHGSNGYLIVSQDKLVVHAEREIPNVVQEGTWSEYADALTPGVPFLFSLPEFVLEDISYIESAKNGTVPENTFENGVSVSRVIDAIRSVPLLPHR